MDQKLHGVATRAREEIKGMARQKMQDNIAQKKGTTKNRKVLEDSGRHRWRATSFSGWTKPG